MLTLFDNKKRVDLDPAMHNENTLDYLDRSARVDMTNVRDLLNKWFSNYPSVEQKELKSRFKKTFSSAFYELFVYNLFRCQNFEIEIHPELPASTKRPDFLMKKGSIEFYLEAKEATDKSKEEESLEKRINHVYAAIDKIKSPNFFLKIDELLLKSKKQPSTKNAINKIEEVIAKCDPDKLAEQLCKFGFDEGEKIECENEDLKLVVSLIPKSPFARGSEGRPIGMYPMESIMGGSEDSIKNSITKKAKRYGSFDKPFFICINATGIKGTADFDVENALWGSLALTWSTDPANRNERWERQLNGVFLDKKGPKIKNVSGLLVTQVNVFNLSVAPHWLVKHPFADLNFDFSVFDLAYDYVTGGHIMKGVGKSIGGILNIKSTWPDS